MGTYDWSLGIDWEVEKDFDNRYFLATGFATGGGFPGRGLASAVKNVVTGRPGDRNVLRFIVFDMTPEEKRQHTTQQITQVKVEFKGLYPKARFPDQRDSPAEGGTKVGNHVEYVLTPGPVQENAFSWPFGGELRAWTCQQTLELVNTGRYLMKVTVSAKATNGETKTWEVDPEMLIGE